MRNPESNKTIYHPGIVQKTDDRSVHVAISVESACSGCHAEGVCSLSGKDEKTVVIPGSYNLKPGTSVTIGMNQSMGFRALILGYLLPLLILIAVIVILISTGFSELFAGSISLSTLVLYYSLIFLFRKRINETFFFIIKI